jgi:LacI family transcriptional regulator
MMAPGPRPTLHDVAARAGVSARTVSRVVNRENVVSKKTAAAVEAVIEELGYRPNMMARALINRRSGMVALMVTSMNNPFFGEFADAVRAAAAAQDLTLVLASSDNDPESQRRLLQNLESHAIEGVIGFCARNGQESIIEFAGRGTPFVLVNDDMQIDGVVPVLADLVDGARQAVAHLVERGHRRIGMIAGDLDSRHAGLREKGFLAASESLGVAGHSIVQAPQTVEGGYRGLHELLDVDPAITGVFAFNDVMASGAIRAARDLGRAVPGDLSVIGFDDIKMSELLTPGLTTIRNDTEAFGQLAIETLVDLIESGESATRPDPLKVELVVREST